MPAGRPIPTPSSSPAITDPTKPPTNPPPILVEAPAPDADPERRRNGPEQRPVIAKSELAGRTGEHGTENCPGQGACHPVPGGPGPSTRQSLPSVFPLMATYEPEADNEGRQNPKPEAQADPDACALAQVGAHASGEAAYYGDGGRDELAGRQVIEGPPLERVVA